jgi:F-type H+-transporting ATPase subunit epsilon
MAIALQVDLVTPERAVYSGPASEVVLPAWDGQMGVYPDHDSLLALLRSGTCVIHGSDGVLRFVVGRGFAEIGPERVTMLTDSCEPVASVDKDRAAHDLAAAEAVLATADPATEHFKQAQVAAEHARARLDAMP